MSKGDAESPSISVKAETYELLQKHAERLGVAVSHIVELAVAREPGTTPPKPRPFRRRARKI